MKKIIIAITIFLLATAAVMGFMTLWPSGQDTSDIKGGDVVVDPQPKDQRVEVTLYFMNNDYVVTGNESLEKLIPVKRTITIGGSSLESAILEELKKAPENVNLSTSLGILKVLSVETVEGTAYVNLSSNKLHGGSLQEMSIIDQVVYSLTELDHIVQVQFLVDGSKRESLMGHFNIEEPFKRPQR